MGRQLLLEPLTLAGAAASVFLALLSLGVGLKAKLPAENNQCHPLGPSSLFCIPFKNMIPF